MGMESDFCWYMLETHECIFLEQDGYRQPRPTYNDSRLNDGRCDRHGRFVIGGHEFRHDLKRTAFLYSCTYKDETSLDVKVISGVDPFTCANSICFNDIGTEMYFADSPEKWIKKYPYNTTTG